MIRALVDEYYPLVYRLAACLLGEENAATEASLETFANAPDHLHRYRSQVSPRAWIISIGIKACEKISAGQVIKRIIRGMTPRAVEAEAQQALNREEQIETALWRTLEELSDRVYLALVLYHLLGFSPAEIAYATRTHESESEAHLHAAHHACRQAVEGLELPGEILENSEVEERVGHLLTEAHPAESFSPSRLERALNESLRRTQASRVRSRRVVLTSEIALVLAVIFILTGLIWGSEKLIGPPEAAEDAGRSGRSNRTQEPVIPRRSPYPPFPSDALYTVKAGDNLLLLALKLRTSPGKLREVNRLPPGAKLQPGQTLLIPGRVTPGAPIKVTPVTPAPTQPPLSVTSPPEEIILRTFDSWNNLWMDILLTYYGPPGDNTPEQAYRMQLWIGGNHVLALSGIAGENPFVAYILNQDGGFFAEPGAGKPWFIQDDSFEHMMPFFGLFQKIFGLTYSSEGLPQDLQVVGTEAVSGRVALTLEYTEPALNQFTRLWIDANSGLLLRKQVFTLDAPQELIYETRSLNFAFNINLPVDLFDQWLPWRGGFAQDSQGAPIPADTPPLTWDHKPVVSPTLITPPPDFDVSSHDLELQFLQPLNIFSTPPGATIPANLFAGGYYLGQINFPNPIFLSCERSPDGQRLAFQGLATEGSFEVAATPLYWLDLANPGKLSQLDGIPVTEYRFSPDGHRLAFVAMGNTLHHGVYLLDTVSGKVNTFYQDQVIHSLAWSPDGESLAFLTSQWDSNDPTRLILVRVRDGVVMYSDIARFEAGRLILKVDSPVREWGAQLPLQQGDFTTCVRAPTK